MAGPLIVNAITDAQTEAGKSGADLYTLSMYIMVGVLGVGFLANLMIRPVSERHMEQSAEATRRSRRTAEPALRAATERS